MYFVIGLIFVIINIIAIKVIAHYDKDMGKEDQLFAMFWSLAALLAWPLEIVVAIAAAIVYGLYWVFNKIIDMDFSSDSEDKDVK